MTTIKYDLFADVRDEEAKKQIAELKKLGICKGVHAYTHSKAGFSTPTNSITYTSARCVVPAWMGVQAGERVSYFDCMVDSTHRRLIDDMNEEDVEAFFSSTEYENSRSDRFVQDFIKFVEARREVRGLEQLKLNWLIEMFFDLEADRTAGILFKGENFMSIVKEEGEDLRYLLLVKAGAGKLGVEVMKRYVREAILNGSTVSINSALTGQRKDEFMAVLEVVQAYTYYKHLVLAAKLRALFGSYSGSTYSFIPRTPTISLLLSTVSRTRDAYGQFVSGYHHKKGCIEVAGSLSPTYYSQFTLLPLLYRHDTGICLVRRDLIEGSVKGREGSTDYKTMPFMPLRANPDERHLFDSDYDYELALAGCKPESPERELDFSPSGYSVMEGPTVHTERSYRTVKLILPLTYE